MYVPMDVFLGVIRGVILYDPLHGGDVQPPRRHISTQQRAALCFAELQKGCSAAALLLLAMDAGHLHVQPLVTISLQLVF